MKGVSVFNVLMPAALARRTINAATRDFLKPMNAIKQYHYQLINDMRPYILTALKRVFGDTCANCGLRFEYYEIDHKRYVADITIFDLQLLCNDCHREKAKVSGDQFLVSRQHCDTCACFQL